MLASSSPRRRELLALLDSPFEVRPPAIDEGRAAEPARLKARAVQAPGATILAADTRVRLGDEELGKPRDASAATSMLLRLAGSSHIVVTDVAVIDAARRETHVAVETRVRMRTFDREQAAAYVDTGEPLDAAGAYQVQGRGATLIGAVEGCLANVVGLPLCHVYEALRRAGRAPRERPERVCQEHFAFNCPVWRHAQAQGHSLRDRDTYRTWYRDLPSSVLVAR